MSETPEFPSLDGLTQDDLAALRPRRSTRLRWQLRELRSAIGREGLRSLVVFVLVILVLAVGILFTGRTWNRTEIGHTLVPREDWSRPAIWVLIGACLTAAAVLAVRSIARRWWLLFLTAIVVGVAVPLFIYWTEIAGWDGVVSLAAFWIMFVAAAAICGWLLSAQVTKPWLRAYVAVALVLATLLLITIGRNARVEEARDDRLASARPLLASWSEADQEVAAHGLRRLVIEDVVTDPAARILVTEAIDEIGTDDREPERIEASLETLLAEGSPTRADLQTVLSEEEIDQLATELAKDPTEEARSPEVDRLVGLVKAVVDDPVTSDLVAVGLADERTVLLVEHILADAATRDFVAAHLSDPESGEPTERVSRRDVEKVLKILDSPDLLVVAVSDPGNRVLVEAALLARVCADIGEDGGGARGDEPRQLVAAVDERCAQIDDRTMELEPFDPELPTPVQSHRLAILSQLELECLEGWSVAAIDVWLAGASLDREVAALSALSSCEAGAANPAAELAAAPTAETSDEAGEGGDPDTAGTPPDESADAGSDEASADGTPSDEAVAAVQSALEIQRTELPIHEAVARGSDEILQVASGPTDFAEFRFSGVAWLLLLFAALIWYRQLEIRAGAHRLGPVDVVFDEVESGDDNSSSNDGGESAEEKQFVPSKPQAVFRESVIQNIDEPGAVPGSEALAPVGDLVSQSDIPNKNILRGVIDAAQMVFATRGGFTVLFSSRDSTEAEPEESSIVFVRLRDRRTGGQVASQVLASSSDEKAAQKAGYWTAGWIIERSDYVPTWAKWSENDADIFMDLKWSGESATSMFSTNSGASNEVEGPAINSVALTQRAYQRQIWPPQTGSSTAQTDGPDDRRDHLGALEDFARAVHREDRYPVARYRRNAALATMMHIGGKVSTAAGLKKIPAESQRRQLGQARLVYLFRDLITRDSRLATSAQADEHISTWVTSSLNGNEFRPELRTQMLRIAAEWSNRNRMAIRSGWAASLRPSERSFWRDFHQKPLRSDWILLLRSDLCLAAERLRQDAARRGSSDADGPPSDRRLRNTLRKLEKFEERVSKRAIEPDSHWQISYNLACLWSIRAGGLAKECTSLRSTARSDRRIAERLERSVADLRRRIKRLEEQDTPRNRRLAAICRERLAVVKESATRRRESAERATDSGRAKCEAAEELTRVALAWLERCLDRPSSDQLVREWVIADGDLVPLHGDPRFEAWTTRVRSLHDVVPSVPES